MCGLYTVFVVVIIIIIVIITLSNDIFRPFNFGLLIITHVESGVYLLYVLRRFSWDGGYPL